MYLWEVDRLVEDFKAGEVSQSEEFKYMLLFTILMALGSDPALYIGASYNYYDTIESALMLGISVIGIHSCYKINKNGDNRDFIVRVMCIGLPVVIRILAIFIPIFIISAALEGAFLEGVTGQETETYESTPIQVAVLSVFVASYYWYLSRKIRAVSTQHA
jgi:hypothetical protein